MCIKIVGTESLEFNPNLSLVDQISDAKEIIVNYNPSEKYKIDNFVSQMEKMVDTGTGCKFAINVEPNHEMDGFRLRTKLKKIKYKLDINEAIKKLSLLYSETDRKILEIAERCLSCRRPNEH